MRNKRTYRLTESRLRGMIHEAVTNVLRENDNEKFFETNYPWRNNPDCSTIEGLIEWGRHCSKDFESGRLSIHNYLCDLDRMANGYSTYVDN